MIRFQGRPPEQTKEQMPTEEIPETERVYIRRQWNDWRIGLVSLKDISGFRWGTVSGGVHTRAPQACLYAYVSCARVRGEIGHSCSHGPAPHCIKVCIVKKDNSSGVFKDLLARVGPKPKRRSAPQP